MKKYNVLTIISSVAVALNFFNIILLEVIHKMNIVNVWNNTAEIIFLIVLPILNIVTVAVALIAVVLILIDKHNGKELYTKKAMSNVTFALLNLIISFVIVQYSIVGGGIFSIFSGIN